jgi:hypothetical protein
MTGRGAGHCGVSGNPIDSDQIKKSFAISGIEENSGTQMIAGLNKTLVWGLVIGVGVWWMFLRPKKRRIGV